MELTPQIINMTVKNIMKAKPMFPIILDQVLNKYPHIPKNVKDNLNNSFSELNSLKDITSLSLLTGVTGGKRKSTRSTRKKGHKIKKGGMAPLSGDALLIYLVVSVIVVCLGIGLTDGKMILGERKKDLHDYN